ncbi:MAG: UMP kinase [Bacteroidales bacterium]|nr:UMP kinase [Bacteroidales bacterium]
MEKYKRILLKLSGESLAEKGNKGISPQRLDIYVSQIRDALQLGIQVSIVLGGGNIFRGLSGSRGGYDRVKSDYMGMMATIINGLGLLTALEKENIPASLYTAFEVQRIGTIFDKRQAISDLENGKVVILTGGTGNPYFTTDSAAALRAVEIEADVLLKGTRVDGVYSADPEKDPSATKFDTISFDQVLEKELAVMDLTAFTLCKENNMSILVYNSENPDNLLKILKGEKIGTLVKTQVNTTL